MPLSALVQESILSLEAPDDIKKQALHNLELWLTHEEFKEYRPQIEYLISEKKWAGLLDRFSQILPFGTGGRRGPVGVGPNRMNLWTLGASVQGHCEYLKHQFPDLKKIHVALAYDVRCFMDKRKQYNPNLPNPALNLSSKELAAYAARVYAANGIYTYTLPLTSNHYIATPELSFSIRLLKAQGGLNISASHNPPDDNGGKFYDERGGQPVPPNDQIMADLVDLVQDIHTMSWEEAVKKNFIQFISDEPHKEYISLCCAQRLIPAPKKDEPFKVVFSPLHGVGSMTSMEILQNEGFNVIPVPEQMSPDGQFPNVTKTPNPEIPECLDRAEVVAKAHNAHLLLATDPDADRLGAMIPDDQGGWRYVNGNEIAAISTCFKLEMMAQNKKLTPNSIVVKTEVTTGMISRIAKHFKVQVLDDLLVGFKYVSDVLWQLESTGKYAHVTGAPSDFIIASEESHGILSTDKIRDKDAGAAALLFAEWALYLFRNKTTTLKYLNQLFERFGYYRNVGLPIALPGVEGKALMTTMLNNLRNNPPKTIGGMEVTSVTDFLDTNGKLGPIKSKTDAASRNVLVYRCGEFAKIALRPSGTEPKAKIYLEVCTAPRASGMSDEQWQAECMKVNELMKKAGADFFAQALKTIGMTPADLKS
jgi:phosphoglucomutase/phosphomannomutase